MSILSSDSHGTNQVHPLTIAIGNYGLTKPLKDGSIRSPELNLEYIQVDPIVAAMRRMVRGLEFDICEMAFTTYLCAKAYAESHHGDSRLPHQKFPPLGHLLQR